MSSEQDKLSELFSDALTHASPEERRRFLDVACGADRELRREVDSLLLAHSGAGDFLRRTVVPREGQTICEGPSSVIGRYKVLQQIGEGGFGVVFMAEQQEPVRRVVALKILKPGMDSREVIARFEAERQALALMDHPNVARVLDGGVVSSGRPYFVMDLVKGVPITDFCDKRKFSTEQRLQLFLKVCAAVQHAHQKGVIHRDLKPSNILVTLHDGEPVPKVIDFGVAKAIGQKLTERTFFTRFEQLIGTPAYMSPEQAEWSGLDVDTRTDIYALGVLLYELLTGTTPFEKETLAQAALDEVRRLIRETEPPAPSTRLLALGNRADEIARQRQTEAVMLVREVRRELDWIVLKTLDKDRNRRYETVNALARDLERHLNGEPVLACPPSRAYLTAKFVRKHRLAVTASAAVTLALAIGLVIALLGLVEARRARARAQEQAAVAQALTGFLTKDLLYQDSPDSGIASDASIREVIDRADGVLRDERAAPNWRWPEISEHLGNHFFQVGNYEKAAELFIQDLRFLRRVYRPDHKLTANAEAWLADTYGAMGQWAAAVDHYREALGTDRDSEGWAVRGAVAALLAGETNAYREFVGRTLGRFATTTNEGVAASITRVSLLRPDLIADSKAVFKLADFVTPDRPGLLGNHNLAKGMAAYRRGTLAEALKWFEGWQSFAENNYGSASLAGYFCAMIHFNQGDFAAAQADLREAAIRLEALVRSGELGSHWALYGKAVVVRAEAERLILGREVSSTVDAAWLKQARARWAPVRRRLNEGDRLALEKRWKEARDEYLAAIREPAFDWRAAEAAWPIDDSMMATKIGVTFLLAGDIANHEKLCQQLLTRLEEHSEAGLASRVLQTYCLARELKPAGELARTADEWAVLLAQDPVRVTEVTPPVVALIRAMVAYRSGRYEEAVNAAKISGSLAVLNSTQIFRAMALARLGRREEAKRDLQQAKTSLAKPLEQLTGGMWWNLAMCQLLLDEAHRVLAEEPVKQ